MVSFKIFAALAVAASPLLQTASAHPGEVRSSLSFKREAALLEHLAARGAEKLARCADSLKAREVKQRSLARRAAKVEALKRRALAKRDAADVESYDVSHNYTGSVSQDDVFSNTSCILEPQMVIGPYWVSGELIRADDKEDQEGVDMTLELEFIDVNTCEPVSGLYIDKWHANSTGVYSGVLGESDLDSTYLRAIQITDDDGIVTFDTTFPGHYEGRAIHTHIMVTENVTAYDNNTYTGGTVRSISQLFYDTEVRAAVEAVEPYASNTKAITSNEDDGILSETTLGDYDPFVKYIYLGEDISDGIFAWHSIGIDVSADYTSLESAVSHYEADGGVDLSGSSGVAGGTSGSTNGTGPDGNGTSFSGTGVPSGFSGVPPSGSNTGFATATLAAASGTASRTTTTLTASTTSADSSSSATTAVSNSGAAGTKGAYFGGKSKPSRIVERPGQKPSEAAGGACSF